MYLSNGEKAETEKKPLTQEMFEEEIKRQMETNECIDSGPFFFESYIVDGLEINDSLETYGGNIEFINCEIKNLDVDITDGCCSVANKNGVYYQTEIEFNECYINTINTNVPLTFNGCTIKDYSKVELYTFHKYTFDVCGPCIFEIEPQLACPKEGGFIGYKKCIINRLIGDGYDYCIVKLLIPEDAKRSSGIIDEDYDSVKKCRCDKAKVLGIYRLNGLRYLIKRKAESCHVFLGIKPITYEVGKWVYPDKFDDNRYTECSNGIHFFMTFDEAKKY